VIVDLSAAITKSYWSDLWYRPVGFGDKKTGYPFGTAGFLLILALIILP
jgi:hypothetical protein